MRILPGEKIEICRETDNPGKNPRHYPRWLKLVMPETRMKGKTCFLIKCVNLPKSQRMKERSLSIALKNDLLPTFKEGNNREKSANMMVKKVVWLNKVSDWPMGFLVIWLKKSGLKLLIIRISGYVWS